MQPYDFAQARDAERCHHCREWTQCWWTLPAWRLFAEDYEHVTGQPPAGVPA